MLASPILLWPVSLKTRVCVVIGEMELTGREKKIIPIRIAGLLSCYLGLKVYIIIIFIIIIIIIIIELLTSQLWLGNTHLSWDVVINRIRLGVSYL